ncbi:MAG: addiction module antitoxin [Blastocatellia bacterium]|nr:addiction module antitoxin [Blastocatellia bacterium]
MRKKLTITIDEQVYNGLHSVIGPRKISNFIESLVRPHVVEQDLDGGYAAMAADEAAEAEAMEWIEGTMGDVGDEPW